MEYFERKKKEKKKAAHKGFYNNCWLCLEDKFSILEYAENNKL